MEKLSLESWPEDLQHAFAAIGRAMNGKRLVPEILALVPSSHGSVVPQHLTSVSHVSGTSGRRRGHYIIRIVGPRTDGQWRFRAGQLETLSRLAAPAAGDAQPLAVSGHNS
jgi:hypothetical protein